MFRTLFNDEEKALRLYCAVSGQQFKSNTKVELKTLDNVYLSKARNDLAFLVDGRLIVIIEHQATLNQNMPLRVLQYIMQFYDLFYGSSKALYKDKRIKIPEPAFYMLYNGTKPYPASGIIRLSDSFMGREEGKTPSLELILNVVNINYGINTTVLEKSEELNGYAFFVENVMRHMANGVTRQEAIKITAEECIRQGKLIDFLKRYKNEVDSMFPLIYDEKIAREVAWEEGWEDGREEGKEVGRKEGREVGREEGREVGREEGEVKLIERMLLKGRRAEDIAEDTDIPLERVVYIRNGLVEAAALVL
jgi:uncharacterized protein YoaH (UPF0181 family)